MSRNRDPDFFAWSDSDVDLDELFEGDYTDNDSVCTDKHSVSVDKKDIYVCPICSREYKTISGFRGHVTKKHDENFKGMAFFFISSKNNSHNICVSNRY